MVAACSPVEPTDAEVCSACRDPDQLFRGGARKYVTLALSHPPRLASEGPTKAKPGRPRYAVVIWLSDDDVRKSSARSLQPSFTDLCGRFRGFYPYPRLRERWKTTTGESRWTHGRGRKRPGGGRRNGETPNPKCNSARDAREGPTDRPQTNDRSNERKGKRSAELIEGNSGTSHDCLLSPCPLSLHLHLPMQCTMSSDTWRETERRSALVELMQNAPRTLFDNVSVASAPPPRAPACQSGGSVSRMRQTLKCCLFCRFETPTIRGKARRSGLLN